MTVRVQAEPFDPAAELAAFTEGLGDVGAIAQFVGLVRSGPDGVTALTLEHWPEVTDRKLADIETEARTRFDLAGSLIVHRYGRMQPGEPIVLVAAASAHRQAAFDGCAFMVDWLKTKAPFWKREETAAGAQWVEARRTDDEAADRWNAPAGSGSP